MEQNTTTIPIYNINNDMLVNKLIRLRLYLKNQDTNIRWVIEDTKNIKIDDLDYDISFRPVVKLLHDNIIQLVNEPPTNRGGGTDRYFLPRYIIPCWGYCGAYQKIDMNMTKLKNIDPNICNFTPFDISTAQLSETNYQNGKNSWNYTVDNKSYNLTKIDNKNGLDVFTQINSSDKNRKRQVLRMDMQEAKRLIIQSEIFDGMSPNKKALLMPLFNSNNFINKNYMNDNDDKTEFPIEIYNKLYDDGIFISDKYRSIVEQSIILEKVYGNITGNQVLNIFTTFSFNKPFDYFLTPINIIF
jgi:hypothetical protein